MNDYYKMMKAYGEDQAEKQQFPHDAQSYSETCMNRRAVYNRTRDGKKVRIVIVDAHGKSYTRGAIISTEEFVARPKADPKTKAEATWAFGVCNYRT